MDYNTQRFSGKTNCKCTTCGVDFYEKPGRMKGVNFCKRDCMYIHKRALFFEELKVNHGIENFSEWLDYKYNVEKLNTRELAVIIYGKPKSKSSITRWMRLFGIEARDRSSSVALQWADNDNRRSEQAEHIKTHIGAGTPARERLIEVMQTDEYKLKHSISKTGKLNGMYGVTGKSHPMWNECRSEEDRIMKRSSKLHNPWRKSVFDRDYYTCQTCGDSKGGNLVAHHLNGYNWDVENRFNPDNGVTLCEPCHLDFHKEYGFGNNTVAQFERFKNGIQASGYEEQMELL